MFKNVVSQVLSYYSKRKQNNSETYL